MSDLRQRRGLRTARSIRDLGVGYMKVRVILASLFLLLSFTIPASAGGGGFDQFGYNRTARIFNGTGSSWCQGKIGWSAAVCDAYMGAYAQDKLVMKWNAEWDRGNATGWSDPDGYGAYEDNEWNGKCGGCSGEVWHYKTVWSASCKATNTPPEGGYCIWGQFAVVMDQGTIPGEGHVWLTKAVPNGYGVNVP